MCLLDAQMIFYPLATFSLVFFGLRAYKRYRSTKKDIVTGKPDKSIDSVS